MRTTSPRVFPLALLASPVVAIYGCVGAGKVDDSATAACPSDLASFCEYEFGGACPTFDEASEMTCDGYHFDASGGGTPAESRSNPEDECPPRVMCMVDSLVRTRLYFEYGSGRLEGVLAEWPESDACPGTVTYGQLWC